MSYHPPATIIIVVQALGFLGDSCLPIQTITKYEIYETVQWYPFCCGLEIKSSPSKNVADLKTGPMSSRLLHHQPQVENTVLLVSRLGVAQWLNSTSYTFSTKASMFHQDVQNLTGVASPGLQKSLVPGCQPSFLFLFHLVFSLFFSIDFTCCHVTPWREVSRQTSDLVSAMLP